MNSLKKTILASLVSSAVIFGAPAVTGISSAVAATTSVAASLPDFADIVDKTSPAVVNIRTTQKVTTYADGSDGSDPSDAEMQEFFRRFFGVPLPTPQQPQQPKSNKKAPQQQQQEVPRGVGSGFIISNDGYVMTNAHVVDGASDVYITLKDKREFKAKVIGSDKRTDVALLKIDAKNLPVLPMGDSNKIRAGQWVLAIGSPFGLENTVTAGIISAKARDTGDYLPLIQTDVAVNPGNSGGPLINLDGEVVGINSQIYSRSGGFMGISFAVPIDEALRVADQLKATGQVVRGRIGVQIGDVTKDVSDSLGMPNAIGAMVVRVESDGPAAKAGVEPGDIITKFNGTAIDHASDLPRMVGDTKPGSKATVTVWRKGKELNIPMSIVAMESDKEAAEKAKQRQQPPKANSLGLAVTDLTADQKRQSQVDNGVVVSDVSGPAASVGIQPGDIIQRINDTDIQSAAQFNAVVAKLDKNRRAAVLVRRGDVSQFVPIRPSK